MFTTVIGRKSFLNPLLPATHFSQFLLTRCILHHSLTLFWFCLFFFFKQQSNHSMLGVHASAWAIIHYGYIARKQGLTGVCLDSLSRFVQTLCAGQHDKQVAHFLQTFFLESIQFPAFLSWTVSKRSDNRWNAICRWLVAWASKSYKR